MSAHQFVPPGKKSFCSEVVHVRTGGDDAMVAALHLLKASSSGSKRDRLLGAHVVAEQQTSLVIDEDQL